MRSLVGEGREVTLRFESKLLCSFVEERKVKTEGEESSEATIEEEKRIGGGGGFGWSKSTASTLKVYRTITEYVWQCEHSYDIYMYAGTDPTVQGSRVVLQSRTNSCRVVTTGTKEPPIAVSEDFGPFDVSVTWLLKQIVNDDEQVGAGQCRFRVDRSAETCKTPKNNKDVEGALEFFCNFGHQWIVNIVQSIRKVERSVLLPDSADGHPRASASKLSSVNGYTNEIFVPVIPIFMEAAEEEEEDKNSKEGETGGGDDLILPPAVASSLQLPSTADVSVFLAEQCRSMHRVTEKLKNQFWDASDEKSLISSHEAAFYLHALHAGQIATSYFESINGIESMMRNQLVGAIGRSIKESDFDEYTATQMGRILFKDAYLPQPFSYAVRRPNHSPDGILSIEKVSSAGGKSRPIVTTTRNVIAGESSTMRLPINAATTVELGGDRYLHGHLRQCFMGRTGGRYQLFARSKQFSCFMLVIGKLAGPDTFDAKDAIILQNKDEIIIPLLMNEIPSPKEFKDAISSLSPEQRRFAESFRAMQLQSSVFAVAAIQIKPALEMLLGLPQNSLSKEVRLTQDLLSLFIDYTIPSDLLSFDGADDMTAAEKVASVKAHTEKVLGMIDSLKERDIKDATNRADMAFEMAINEHPEAMPMPRMPPEQHSIPFKGRSGLRRKAMPSSAQFGVTAMMYSGVEGRQGGHALESCQAQQQQQSGHVAKSVEKVEADGQPRGDVPSAHLLPSRARKVRDQDQSVTDDFTLIPKMLDAQFEALDTGSALRATTIKVGNLWTKREQKNLLANMENISFNADMQKSAREKAYDLLDALSRSGSLPINCVEVHALVCASHIFDRSIIDTAVIDNVNPIEKVEHSSIIIASTVQGVSPRDLLKGETQVAKIEKFSPLLLADA